METIGLGGRLTFDPSQGVQGMNRAAKAYEDMARRSRKSAGQVQNAARGLKESMGKAGEGVRTVGMAMLPMTVGMGVGVAKAASFEKQMSNVRSILRGAAQGEFQMLQEEAKRLGIVSVFSAQQAGEAMENLAVLGLKPLEIMQAIGPTLDAAAVAGVGLGEAALYVGGSTRAMGLAISETARVADVLTVAGQKSATTLPLMAESLKLAAPAAVQANLSLEETVAILGKLSDAQLRGTMGGTSFVNMMNKLAGPTREAEGLLKDMNVTLTDSQGALRPIIDIVMDVKEGLSETRDAAERLGKAQEIFGIRGARAFSALSLAGREATKDLQRDLENSLGAAQEAAEIRLDNILGAFTLFGASLEGVAIGLFTPFLDAGKDMVRDMTSGLNKILLGLEEMRRPLRAGESEFDRLRSTAEKVGWDVVPVVQGITDAIAIMKDSFEAATDALKDFGIIAKDAFGSDTTREMTKTMMIFFFISAIMAPLMLGIAGVVWGFKGMVLVLGPLPKLLSLVSAAMTWMAATTIPMLIAKMKVMFWYIAMNAALWAQTAIAVVAATWPVLLIVAAFGALIAVMKATQLEGEGLIESFVKNFSAGLGQLRHWLAEFATWIKNLILKPMQWVAKGWIKLQEARGKEVSATLREFTKVEFKAPKKWVPFDERKAPVKRAAGRGVGARLARPGEQDVGGGTGAGWDVMGELQKQIGGAMGTRMEQLEKMAEKMNASVEGTQKAAEAAAASAAKEKCAKLNLDGREVARTVAKNQEEVEARSGFKATPWQRHQAIVHGAIPARK